MNEKLKTLGKMFGDLANLAYEFSELEGFLLDKYGVEIAEKNRNDIKILNDLKDKIGSYIRDELG